MLQEVISLGWEDKTGERAPLVKDFLPRVEVGGNTSTVTLRAVRSDRKGTQSQMRQ
jgi:hypothetical protein